MWEIKLNCLCFSLVLQALSTYLVFLITNSRFSAGLAGVLELKFSEQLLVESVLLYCLIFC